ncbi:MAG: KTSC domain-containing protein [Methanobacteriaceae archaeon]|nr:KTSC domain-containing protein [Methanobacteriaceae archaeon]MDP2835827.1 KTSC domain-containing protein [Methanobacteriaceae archaeon]MDP3034630.1 KTSC domain-containing protein [Methanobacteriaceae archaeon]MDP3623285.1 KTSC domain-containing protein [Methanobacteriaceae archaeon]
MRRQVVHSSNLVSIGYDIDSETLEVEFRDSIYQYYNVPESAYIGLMSEGSKGRYLHKHIKDKFRQKKIK